MNSLFSLTKYIFRYKGHVIVSLTMMFIQVAIGFIIPTIMVDIIDVALPEGDTNMLITQSLIMVSFAFLGFGASLVNNYTSQYVSQFAAADLRLDLFEKIQTLSFKNIDKFKTSRLITSSTNDVLRVQQFYQMLLRIIVRAPFMIGFGLFFAIRESKELSNLYYVTLPLLVSFITILIIVAIPRFKKVQKTLDGLNKVVLETANAPRVIKSFVTADYENERFEEANEQFRVVNTSAEKVMAFAEPAILLIFNASIAGILYLGAYFMNKGDLIDATTNLPQTGTLMAFNSYSMQILFGLMMFAMMMIFVARAEVSAKRIREIMDEEVDLENSEDAITNFTLTGNIEFRNVSFGYGNDGNNVIKGISFKIKPGETVGIVGSTGSGKTSLVNLIPRLYDNCEGEVLLDGNNVKDLDIHNLRKQISFVTQQATVFSGSIGTNIMQGSKDATYEDVVNASKNAIAYEFIKEYDDLFNHEIQSKGTNLSGGQKQRLSLARAFINNPSIMILDDSTSALDAQSEEKLLKSIAKLSSSMTTLVISQKISTVRDMDKIIVLNNQGKLDGFGTHEQLLKDSVVYKEIADSQLDLGGETNE
ncbi:MAG: ABC transporter ATP-binding protein [Candidatus Izemoplasma sp.]